MHEVDAHAPEVAPSSPMTFAAPTAREQMTFSNGKRTRVIITDVPGGVSIRVRPSWMTRGAWLLGACFFSCPLIGAVLGVAGGVAMLLSGQAAVGAIMVAALLPISAMLAYVTYRAACIAFNTTCVEATREHLFVTGSPLPVIGPLDVPAERIHRIDVRWQGGARGSEGAFWAVTARLQDETERAVVQNLSSSEDAQALRAAITDHLGLA
jgi:hypothetical protein